jgi:hypothetical protein
MTYCENCKDRHCEELADVAARLKRIRLSDGTLSPRLEDISVVGGKIEDCPFNRTPGLADRQDIADS